MKEMYTLTMEVQDGKWQYGFDGIGRPVAQFLADGVPLFTDKDNVMTKEELRGTLKYIPKESHDRLDMELVDKINPLNFDD